MSLTLKLLDANGKLAPYTLSGTSLQLPANTQTFSRIAYSAAHVVADARASIDPWLDCKIDWDSTIAYRRRLWSLGLGVAEAMDTAQRGMGLDWPTSLQLIDYSLQAAREARAQGQAALIASGCGTDHLDLNQVSNIEEIIAAYETQMAAIEKLGGKLIMMASRALAKIAQGPQDYAKVYRRILSQANEPVLIHWLGDMFDPALKGYWGSNDADRAMQTALEIIHEHAAKIDGVKISLLDKNKEIQMRRLLPTHGGPDGKGVRMYTGDDFNYAELIAGDGVGSQTNQGQSDALLGIFDAIAPAASAALAALAQGNDKRFHELLTPTVPLSRHIFQAPTRFYKTGVVFMAWLNGHQDHFVMVGGQQSTRSLPHLCELLRLADTAQLIEKPELAHVRMTHLLATHGVV